MSVLTEGMSYMQHVYWKHTWEVQRIYVGWMVYLLRPTVKLIGDQNLYSKLHNSCNFATLGGVREALWLSGYSGLTIDCLSSLSSHH